MRLRDQDWVSCFPTWLIGHSSPTPNLYLKVLSIASTKPSVAHSKAHGSELQRAREGCVQWVCPVNHH